MKIVHAVYSLEVGGAEVLVGQLCQIQRAAGHRVVVLAYAALGSVGEELAEDGFEVYVTGPASPLVTMFRYFRLFATISPDVVHCHNWAATIHGAIPARLAGVPRVLTTQHGLDRLPYNFRVELRASFLMLFCDWLVGICQTTCETRMAAPFAEKAKVVRVYNGAAPVERVDAEGLGKRGFTLLFVGRLAPEKQLETLIRAVSVARNRVPELQLWVVGDGRVRAALESAARELGAAEAVRFWGQRMDTAGFFSAADVFAMSSMTEGVPMSLLQAMSLGVPAILTDVGGMGEVLRLSGGGLLVPVGDVEAMAAAIVRMAEDGALRAECSRKALAAYWASFTLEAMNAGYMALYRVSGKSLDWSNDGFQV